MALRLNGATVDIADLNIEKYLSDGLGDTQVTEIYTCLASVCLRTKLRSRPGASIPTKNHRGLMKTSATIADSLVDAVLVSWIQLCVIIRPT